MLDKHLIASSRPQANGKNIILWKNYRVTVLDSALFRLERSENKIFRDEATQTVWFRDAEPQQFTFKEENNRLTVTTPACSLIVDEKRENCRVLLNGKTLEINNEYNLLGTYRTLDEYDGDTYVGKTKTMRKRDQPQSARIKLGNGVCSLNGVAVLDDSASLTLAQNGEVVAKRADGSDEYIFAYGNDYRLAVKALYKISGNVPMIPRFALGNWWSRYHVYTDKEYIRLLNSFEEENVPLSVATIDMDWHYSTQMEEDLHITDLGRNSEFYGGNNGWTGYTWNKRLFPDYKAFLNEIKKKKLKITLNVHPADGVRWWEECYKNMARALGRDENSGEWIKFDIASPEFINAYFSQIHKPYEEDGVRFWWIDWQQGVNSKMEGLDPLWALNHYHYLDNGLNYSSPMILSRYSGVGAHRYPLGFSGDTVISWDTLEWLPEFTATATNVGYTWWSHDIGGHMFGAKEDELYLRHIQYGVFSPINRLHCSCEATCTKEPWAYGNGAGEIAKKWLRLRHQLIPYIYTASYLTHTEGRALVEPLYNEWKCDKAYEYRREYLFGSQLLVAPVYSKTGKCGFAKVKAWLPEGNWTDIFTGAKYCVGKGGKEVVLHREMESIPVFIKEGGILPLSLNEGNGAENPKVMQVNVYEGNGEYTLYEDGFEQEKQGKLFTKFVNKNQTVNGEGVQTLTVSTSGDFSVIPQNRELKIRFKDIQEGSVEVLVNGVNQPIEQLITDCVALNLTLEANSEYVITVRYAVKSQMQKLLDYALKVLIMARGEFTDKQACWKKIEKATTVSEYKKAVNSLKGVSQSVKNLLKEIL